MTQNAVGLLFVLALVSMVFLTVLGGPRSPGGHEALGDWPVLVVTWAVRQWERRREVPGADVKPEQTWPPPPRRPKLAEHEDLEQQVTQLVAERLADRGERLLPTTELGRDLGVTGDDAAEFMEAFAERFNVDLSGFEFDLHFGPEAGCNPFGFVWMLLFDRDQLKFVPITVADLWEAARTQRWQTPRRAAT